MRCSVGLSTCLPICLFVYLSVCLCIHLQLLWLSRSWHTLEALRMQPKSPNTSQAALPLQRQQPLPEPGCSRVTLTTGRSTKPSLWLTWSTSSCWGWIPPGVPHNEQVSRPERCPSVCPSVCSLVCPVVLHPLPIICDQPSNDTAYLCPSGGLRNLPASCPSASCAAAKQAILRKHSMAAACTHNSQPGAP